MTMKIKSKILRRASAATLAGCLACSCGIVAGAAEGDSLPSSYSSAEQGYVTPIKRQQYQDCAFNASIATFESALLRAGYDIGEMSVDHMNVWCTTRSNSKGWIRDHGDSGYSSSAAGYFTSWQGGVLKTDLPGFKIEDFPYGDSVPTDLAGYGATAIRFVSDSDPQEVKRQIYEHGGVYTAYSQSSSCMGNNSTTYYMPPDYNGYYIGHAIELVGWDDDFAKENFANPLIDQLPENNGAWLVRNSWGDNNKLGGYFWMSYENKDVLSKRYNPSFSFEQIEEITSDKKLLQNEIYGATYDFNYVNNQHITFLNHFDFTDEWFTVDKIVFKTSNAGAPYSLYFVPDDGDAPDNNRSNWVKLSSGTLPYNGYICDDIQNYEVPKQKGSIAVELDTSDLGKNADLGVDEWLTDNNDEYVFINESERGQSYIAYDGKMQDLMDCYKEVCNDDIGGTFVIKALTTKTGDFLIGDVNLDGKVNINDATEIQKYLAGITTLSGRAQRAADFHRDDHIVIDDATAIQRYLVNPETSE